MTDQERAVLEKALEALEERYVGALRDKAMDALRAALPCTYKCEAWPECACAAQQEPTVRFKCTVVDNQNPNGVPFEQWAHKPLAGMSEMNRTIAYCAASKLRELGYEWDGKTWAALAQQEQEPVAWMLTDDSGMRFVSVDRPHPDFVPLYTTPLRREWKSLTNEELNRIESQARSHDGLNLSFLFLEIQQALKEKNQ